MGTSGLVGLVGGVQLQGEGGAMALYLCSVDRREEIDSMSRGR